MLAPGKGRVAVAARGIEAAPTIQSCVAAILSPMKSSTKERHIAPGKGRVSGRSPGSDAACKNGKAA